MRYRPSSNPPATRWARHLDSVMRERGVSRVQMFEEIGAELGYAPKSRSAFLKLLEDREPTPAQEAVLLKRFGEPPADVAPEPPPDDLAAALRAQAAAIESQAEAIRDLTAEIRVASLAVLTGQEGTAEMVAQLIAAAREGTLDGFVSSLRGGTPR